MSRARKHHTVPQFLLRNFAVDLEKKKVTSVAKFGKMAVWKERSIGSIGYEPDFYVHSRNGQAVSVEEDINRLVETPITRSQTWAKIKNGHTETLDASDRGVLQALIKHFEFRTPHYRATGEELVILALSDQKEIPFADEERRFFELLGKSPGSAKVLQNRRSTTSIEQLQTSSSMVLVKRSPIALRTSTTPVIPIKAPHHPAMNLPLPGMVPFQRVLAVDPTTLIILVEGEFNGAFSNEAIDEETAIGLNKTFLAYFAKFPHMDHLITGRERLIEDMCWGPFELVEEQESQVIFRRTD
ncbi:MAG: hypothetical protein CME84_05880 [Henriciella sp.]|nr:hypothetical protein [Henriciella sp.]